MTALGDPIAFAPDFSQQAEPYGTAMPRVLEACLRASAGPYVLDVAGGYGRYALPLAHAGHTVEIVDLHDASLREAQRRAAADVLEGRVLTRLCDVRAGFIAEAGAYDLAICIGFLHHLAPSDGAQVVHAMVDSVRDGGRIVFEISTEKRRRLPDGTPILIGGSPERSWDVQTGIDIARTWLQHPRLCEMNVEVVPLSIRDPDFFYDAEVIIVTGGVG